MKKHLLLTFLILLPAIAVADDNGTCGEGIVWFYSEETQTLTISGNGAMSDYRLSKIPWKNYQESIRKVIIEEGINHIGNAVFYNCQKLEIVSIPNSVISIGSRALYGCKNLPSITIPSNITSIGGDAFYGCSNLSKVNIYNLSDWCRINFLGESSNPLSWAHHLYINEELLEKLFIPDDISTIKNYTFQGCSDFISITIHDNITSIGDEAFQWCTSFPSIIIPDGVTSLGEYAFSGCSDLISVNIPNNIKSINDGTFNGCSSLRSITIPNGVTEIGDIAFSGCSSLTTIDIPDGITSIGGSAFHNCDNLSNIKIPNSVQSIGDWAFSGCSSLTTINLPISIKSISRCCFRDCTNLTTMNIPKDVISIGSSAFYGCSSLAFISIPKSVTSIGSVAFCDCKRLKVVKISDLAAWCAISFADQYSNPLYYAGFLEVNDALIQNLDIPNSVILINNYAFISYKDLRSVKIPQSVTSIGENAFSGCTNLTSLILSENLKYIRKQAFYNCHNVKSISIPATTERIYQEAFDGCNIEQIIALPTIPPLIYDNSFSSFSIPVKVPKGCKETYQTAEGWKNFTYVYDANKYKLTYIIDGIQYKTFEVDEGTIITPETQPTKEGYTFSGWSEIPETMPSHDVTITGTFTINNYKLTYMIDDKLYKETMYEYGATITPEPHPEGDYQTFEWTDLPQIMPAHDVVVHATYTTGIIGILKARPEDVKVFSPDGKRLYKPQKGINIIRTKDGKTKKIVIKRKN